MKELHTCQSCGCTLDHPTTHQIGDLCVCEVCHRAYSRTVISKVFPLQWKGSSYRMRILQGSPLGQFAYSIGADGALTDRFARTYIVKADEKGRPRTCSCPDHFHRQSFCKHLRMLEEWWYNNSKAGQEARRTLDAQALSLGL